MATLLLADDNTIVRYAFALLLRSNGYLEAFQRCGTPAGEGEPGRHHHRRQHAWHDGTRDSPETPEDQFGHRHHRPVRRRYDALSTW